jgi:putative hemolysin
MPADDLRETLALPRLPAEEKGEYHTLAGFVIHHLNRIPKQGDCFRYGGWEFEVLDMDGLRVDKVLATAKAEESD